MNFFSKKKTFSSKDYWETRYAAGGNSGSGSYNELAQFKADIINGLIAENQLDDAIEFGVGDGNQLSLINYPKYLGLDVSPSAIRLCSGRFAQDTRKSFMLYDSLAFRDAAGFIRADLALSLDVLYHLVEKTVFENYLLHLFGAAKKMVVIYAIDSQLTTNTNHEKVRPFTADVARLCPGWKLDREIKNPISVAEYGDERGSDASFFIYTPAGR